MDPNFVARNTKGDGISDYTGQASLNGISTLNVDLMHILVTNDDGPPSQQSSPYVHAFIQTLQKAGHVVSVVLPHQQRSWIGKAHFVGQVTKPTYFRPGTIHKDDGVTCDKPAGPNEHIEEWVLVDGTPASCTQLGLYHFFQDRGPVELVVSGPNYGRNSTSLFSLSSGTIGGAMEAAVCAKKAIALSFAFYSRDHDPELIAAASRRAVKVIEHLYRNWSPNTDLYSINVPLVPGVETHKIVYTHALQNYWTSGSSFDEIPATEGDQDPESHEAEIRQGEAGGGSSDYQITRHQHRHFKWAPKFGDIQKSIDAAPPGNDGWAIAQGFTSVTPLKANFMHTSDVTLGELKLSSDVDSSCIFSPKEEEPFLYALINYEDLYVQPLILSAIKENLPPSSYRLISSPSDLPSPSTPFLQITSYETLDFHHLMAHPTTSLANAYIIRKALIRKHWLSHTVSSWLSKHPNSILKDHVKPTPDFELDYAEFLDEALVEAYELHESFARNALLTKDHEEAKKEWWILKPSMSDRGQGIRLFSNEDDLRSIFEEWEADAPDSDADEDPEAEDPSTTNNNTAEDTKSGIMTSHLRHFVAQPYISPPLLLPSLQNRKFHIRSYVLCTGALHVYLNEEMLALFAAQPYAPPSSSLDLQIHLTNTCLQGPESSHDSVHLLSSLPLPNGLYDSIVEQIAVATGALFEAAARGQMVYFQTLPNAFEIFGVDWLVDEGGRAWLLEVNAFPDFKQSGEEGEGVVRGVWEAAVGIAVRGFFGMEGGGGEDGGRGGGGGGREGTLRVRKVLDVDLGRR